MDTKYIRNQYKFIVFPNSIQHKHMADNAIGTNALIHSAGFFNLIIEDNLIKANCHGESESLRVSTRRDDNTSILKFIGVENDEEVEHAKYITYGEMAIIFSNDLSHDKVASAINQDPDSAGFVKLLMHPNGLLYIQCYGESSSLSLSHNKEDYKKIAKLINVAEHLIFHKNNSNKMNL